MEIGGFFFEDGLGSDAKVIVEKGIVRFIGEHEQEARLTLEELNELCQYVRALENDS